MKKENRIKNIKVNSTSSPKEEKTVLSPSFHSSFLSTISLSTTSRRRGKTNFTNKPKTNSFSSSAQCLMKLFINYESKLPSITIEKNNCK
jgi:hypothetical protein